jgi:hypothetical protein
MFRLSTDLSNPDIEVHVFDDLTGEPFGPEFAAFLFFEKNGIDLTPAHRAFLARKAVNVLRDRIGFAEMYAFTDTTGTDQVNEEVSLARLRAVQDFLSQQGVPADKAFDPSNHRFFGEKFARAHDPDSTDDADFRVVAIGLWKDIFKVRSPAFLTFRSFQFGRAQEVLEL